MRIGRIYKVTCVVDKRVYIGQTLESLNRRKQRHMRLCNSGLDIKFYRALRKYGFDNFKWEILYDNIAENQLDIAEMCAIYTFDAYYNGFNSTFGGDINPMKNLENVQKMMKTFEDRGYWENRNPLSAETKSKISQTQKERLKDKPTWNKNLSAHEDTRILSGYLHPMYGKIHPEKTKELMSQNHPDNSGEKNPMFGKHHSEETKQKIKLAKLKKMSI